MMRASFAPICMLSLAIVGATGDTASQGGKPPHYQASRPGAGRPVALGLALLSESAHVSEAARAEVLFATGEDAVLSLMYALSFEWERGCEDHLGDIHRLVATVTERHENAVRAHVESFPFTYAFHERLFSQYGQGIRRYVAALGDEIPEVRLRAASRIREYGDRSDMDAERALKQVTHAMANGEAIVEPVCFALCRQLAMTSGRDHQRDYETLSRSASGHGPAAHRLCSAVLFHHDMVFTPEGLALTFSLLEDPDPLLRAYAADLLGAGFWPELMGTETTRITRRLIVASRDEHVDVRSAAVQALVNSWEWPLESRLRECGFRRIINVVRTDYSVRPAACRALSEASAFRDDVRFLKRALHDARPRVRRWAVQAIARAAAKSPAGQHRERWFTEARELVTPLVGDPALTVASAARACLRTLSDRIATEKTGQVRYWQDGKGFPYCGVARGLRKIQSDT